VRQGGNVALRGLAKVLNDPFYIGRIGLKSTDETFPRLHQPLITKSLFDQVQADLTGKTNTRAYVMISRTSSLIKCKGCGYALIGETDKGSHTTAVTRIFAPLPASART
jgi:hypothetical protein